MRHSWACLEALISSLYISWPQSCWIWWLALSFIHWKLILNPFLMWICICYLETQFCIVLALWTQTNWGFIHIQLPEFFQPCHFTNKLSDFLSVSLWNSNLGEELGHFINSIAPACLPSSFKYCILNWSDLQVLSSSFFSKKTPLLYNVLLPAYPNTQNTIISYWSTDCQVNKSFDYYALKYYWLAIIAATSFVLFIPGKIKSLPLIWFSFTHRRAISVCAFTRLHTLFDVPLLLHRIILSTFTSFF